MNGYGSSLWNISKASYFKIVLFATSFLVVVVVYQTSISDDGPLHYNVGQHIQIAKTDDQTLVGLSAEVYHEVQKQRKLMISKVCKRNKITPTIDDKSKFQHIIVNDKYKLLYCHVPKVACTNWKRVMLILSGKMNVSQPTEISAADAHSEVLGKKYLRTLNTYPLPEIKRKLKTYTKFMFAREPMERLLSAYRNKFTKDYNKYFHDRYGRKIIKNYRKDPSESSLLKGDDVEFHEFIKYLLDPMRIDKLNDHWDYFYKLCCPCIVDYDIIGKYETLVDDAKQVLHRAGVDSFVSFPENRYPGTPTSALMKDAFKNVSEEEVHQLWRMYSVDYAMFGYSYPNFDNQPSV